MPKHFMKHSTQTQLSTWVWLWQMVMAKKVREVTGKTIADQVREALSMYYNDFSKAGLITPAELEGAKDEARERKTPRGEEQGTEPGPSGSVGL